MAATVRLYGAYSQFAGGVRSVAVDAPTLGAALDALVALHPALRERLRDEHGRLREHLSVYVNKDEMRVVGGEGARVKDGDEIHLIPAVSGGS